MYGCIVSEWYIEEGGTRYKIVVPPNTTATLKLKADKRKKIQLVQTPGGRLSGWRRRGGRLQKEDGRFTTQLGSGTYEFFVRDLD
jgi:hypothetical protein